MVSGTYVTITWWSWENLNILYAASVSLVQNTSGADTEIKYMYSTPSHSSWRYAIQITMDYSRRKNRGVARRS